MAVAPGEGTTLKVTITATPTTIVQIVSITPMEQARAVIETKDLSSTVVPKRVGILDNGELEFVINYDPSLTTHAYLMTSFNAGRSETWTLTLADAGAATLAFDGLISSFKIEGLETDTNVTATCKVAVSSAITLTP